MSAINKNHNQMENNTQNSIKSIYYYYNEEENNIKYVNKILENNPIVDYCLIIIQIEYYIPMAILKMKSMFMKIIIILYQK